jgi:sugar fermentation stimulation protein A
MKLPRGLEQASFLARPNRFVARVELAGEETLVHVANTGRLRELLQPGRTVYLSPQPKPERKTRFDLQLVALGPGPGERLVSADSRLPPGLVEEAFLAGRLSQFSGYELVRREVTFGDSRLVLELLGPEERCLIEVKSVTLIEKGVARFPDAPTDRGRRHLRTLMRARVEGHRAAVVFVVQRDDASAFTPTEEPPPAFGDALWEAHDAGVEVYTYRCAVSLSDIGITDEIDVVR